MECRLVRQRGDSVEIPFLHNAGENNSHGRMLAEAIELHEGGGEPVTD